MLIIAILLIWRCENKHFDKKAENNMSILHFDE